jgi:hypothetical protein
MTRYHVSATYRTRTGRVGIFSAVRIAPSGSAALRWAERAIRNRRSYGGKIDARAVPMQ